MISQHLRGSLFAITSGFLYGFLGFFGLSAIKNDLSISNMLFWRFFIAALVLLILLLPKISKLQLSSSILLAFINGAIFYALSTLLYFYACQYISSGLAMVIFFTYPIAVMLVNRLFYQQSIGMTCYLAIGLIITGMVFMVDLQSIQWDLSGLFLGVISGFFYTCYIVSSKQTPLSPEVSTLSVSVGCTLTFFCISYFNHSLMIPMLANTWANLIGIGIIATAIPVLLFLYSLNLISSTKASILSVLEPVFVVIFGILLLGETLKGAHLLGIVFILTGALITLVLGEEKSRFYLSQSRGRKKSV